MRDPTSPRVIQVIQEIKNDVERPRCCRWLENLQSDDTKRTRTRRYRDGAVKIMNLLRPELKAGHILTYQRYYERYILSLVPLDLFLGSENFLGYATYPSHAPESVSMQPKGYGNTCWYVSNRPTSVSSC